MQVSCSRESIWSFLTYWDPDCKLPVRDAELPNRFKKSLSLDCRKVQNFVFIKVG